jgi:hypothetical protein
MSLTFDAESQRVVSEANKIGYETGVRAERERCAKILESIRGQHLDEDSLDFALNQIRSGV